VRLQSAHCRRRLFVGSLAVPVLSELVVQPLGSVDAQTDVEMILCEKCAPRVVKQNPVRLEIIPAAPTLGQILFLQRNRALIEVQPGKRRFPASMISAMRWRMAGGSRRRILMA
jgi:hypothetical protein